MRRGCDRLAPITSRLRLLNLTGSFVRCCAEARRTKTLKHGAALRLVQIWPHDDVDQAGLVLQQQKHKALGRARPLPTNDHARRAHVHAVDGRALFFVRDEKLCFFPDAPVCISFALSFAA